LLQKNLRGYENVTLHNGILVGSACTESFGAIYIPENKRNMGSCSVFSTPNNKDTQQIKTISFAKLLSESKATVLKMDIEGAEWALLENIVLPDCLVKITIECHFPSAVCKNNTEALQLMKNLYTKFQFPWMPCQMYPLRSKYTRWHTLVRFWRPPIVDNAEIFEWTE
jgi:FkbM family methyltransferase